MKKRTRDLAIGGGLMVFGAGALIASNSNLSILRADSQSRGQPAQTQSTHPLPQGTGYIQSATSSRHIITNDQAQINQNIQNSMPAHNHSWAQDQAAIESAQTIGVQGPAARPQPLSNPSSTQPMPAQRSGATPGLCAPEGLAVGIKHFRYDEAAAADLVWSGYGSQSDAKYKIHRLAKPALQELIAAAKRDGVTLTPGSIFRGVARQRQIVTNKRNQGQSPRQIYFTSSHPGFSEHHTGLAVDFTPINAGFERTPAYRWLIANANRYGWYQTFDKSYSQYSGVSEESWHWRYEGKNGEFAHIFAASKNRSC